MAVTGGCKICLHERLVLCVFCQIRVHHSSIFLHKNHWSRYLLVMSRTEVLLFGSLLSCMNESSHVKSDLQSSWGTGIVNTRFCSPHSLFILLSLVFFIVSLKTLNEWWASIKALGDSVLGTFGSRAGIILQDLEGCESQKRKEWFLSPGLRAEKAAERVIGGFWTG